MENSVNPEMKTEQIPLLVLIQVILFLFFCVSVSHQSVDMPPLLATVANKQWKLIELISLSVSC